MPKLTEQEYVERSGVTCPVCEDTGNIEGGPIEVDGHGAWQNITCATCDSSWTDTYALTGYVDLVQADRHLTEGETE